MKNTLKTFQVFCRDDSASLNISHKIECTLENFLKKEDTSLNGDLIIAIGGDGTFLRAVTHTNFDKNKIYAGINTGTLGFFQDISPDEFLSFCRFFSGEKELRTRKLHVPSITVQCEDGNLIYYHAVNEVIIAGKHASKITFAEYVNGFLFQNVSANSVCIASNSGDTALSMNAGGSIDFSDHFQLVRTLDCPIQNAAYERFIRNPIVHTQFSIELKTTQNVEIIIDGIHRSELDSSRIKQVDVSIDGTDYIHKLELGTYSKVQTVRRKILGYED